MVRQGGLRWLDMHDMQELLRREWRVNGHSYRFADEEIVGGGYAPTMPWLRGTEGIAYPLENDRGEVTAFVKFFNQVRATPKRIERTKWLVAQGIQSWAKELHGAPYAWLDTSNVGRPDGIGFDFACAIAHAVPGFTWAEQRGRIVAGQVEFDFAMRRECVVSLLRGLAFLEQRNMLHGDLSPNNIIVNLDRKAGDPALYLIDFDGFVAPTAGIALEQLSLDEGGTIGTPGYHPVDLEQHALAGADGVAPYSDRYGRDMLILELLCFHKELKEEGWPAEWGWQEIERSLEPSLPQLKIRHLLTSDVLTMPEELRPLSYDLASGLGIVLPPRRRVRGRKVTTFTAVRKRRTRRSFVPPERVFRGVSFVLWLICVAHWGIISWWTSASLLPLSEGSTEGGPESWLLGRLAQGLAGVVPFAVGFIGLTILTFSEDQPRLLNVLGLWFRIPARRDSTRSYGQHLLVVIGRLTGILAALALAVFLLVHYL